MEVFKKNMVKVVKFIEEGSLNSQNSDVFCLDWN